MTTKLTLTIEEKVIKAAKTYAKTKGRSVSDLVETYLKSLAGKEISSEDISPQVRRLVGSIKLDEGFDYKSEVEKQIKSKYKR